MKDLQLTPIIAKIFIAFPLYLYFLSSWLGINWLNLKFVLLTVFISFGVKFKYSGILFGTVFVYLFLTGKL
jgi:hypothetical protein